MSGQRRVGYFGGTFDPPHLGHEILAVEACYQLDLEVLYWLITPDPPHKQDHQITPVIDRLPMLEIAVGRNEAFSISLIDLERPAPHYAADTVALIKQNDPGCELVYLLGEDSLRDLPGWYQPDRLLAEIDLLAVAPRPGDPASLVDLEVKLPGISSKTTYLSHVMMDISSSLIRERCLQGEPFKHWLSPEVAEYITRSGLYTRMEDR